MFAHKLHILHTLGAASTPGTELSSTQRREPTLPLMPSPSFQSQPFSRWSTSMSWTSTSQSFHGICTSTESACAAPRPPCGPINAHTVRYKQEDSAAQSAMMANPHTVRIKQEDSAAQSAMMANPHTVGFKQEDSPAQSAMMANLTEASCLFPLCKLCTVAPVSPVLNGSSVKREHEVWLVPER